MILKPSNQKTPAEKLEALRSENEQLRESLRDLLKYLSTGRLGTIQHDEDCGIFPCDCGYVDAVRAASAAVGGE